VSLRGKHLAQTDPPPNTPPLATPSARLLPRPPAPLSFTIPSHRASEVVEKEHGAEVPAGVPAPTRATDGRQTITPTPHVTMGRVSSPRPRANDPRRARRVASERSVRMNRSLRGGAPLRSRCRMRGAAINRAPEAGDAASVDAASLTSGGYARPRRQPVCHLFTPIQHNAVSGQRRATELCTHMIPGAKNRIPAIFSLMMASFMPRAADSRRAQRIAAERSLH
jgi:hypothetical protein